MRDLPQALEQSEKLIESAWRLIELTRRELAHARQIRDAARQACSDSQALVQNGRHRRKSGR